MIKTLEDFNGIKNDLIKELCHLAEMTELYNGKDDAYLKDIHNIRKRLNENTFKTLIVGEFSTGKSTFLNALLGQNLLPTETTETTATINVISYGETPKAIIHYWGQKDSTGYEISRGNTEEIELTKLVDYVTSLTESSDEIAKTIKKVNLFIPSKFCRNSVELVDTPGLNTTYGYHEATTLEYLQNGHFGIMILNATQFLTQSEQLYLQRFKKYMNKVMFVVNYVNQMPEDDSFEDNESYFQRKIQKSLGTKENVSLYPLNALSAEQGEFESSGMQHFINDFEAFLTSDEKTVEMLLPSINQSEEIIHGLQENCSLSLSGLKFSPEDFDQKVNKLQQEIEIIKGKEKDLLDYLDEKERLTMQRFKHYFDKSSLGLINKIENRIDDLTLDEFDADELQEDVKTLCIGMSEDVHSYLSNEISLVFGESRNRLHFILEELHQYREEFSETGFKSDYDSKEETKLDTNIEQLSTFGTISSIAGGSAAVSFIAASLFFPLFIAGIFAGPLIANFLEERKFKKGKVEMKKKIKSELTTQFKKQESELGKGIRKEFTEEKKSYDSILQSHFSSVNNSINSILKTREQERTEIESLITHYGELSANLINTSKRLTAIKNQLQAN